MRSPTLLLLASLLPALAQAAPYHVRTLGIQSYTEGYAVGINNGGTTAGMASGNWANPPLPFTSTNGVVNYGGLLNFTAIWGLSDQGVVVGDAVDASGRRIGAKSDNGAAKLLGDFGWGSTATAINNAGIAVGSAGRDDSINWRAVVFENGAVNDIGTLGGNYSSGTDINDAGVVVGNSEVVPGAFGSHAFIYSKGVMTDLGTAGGSSSAATRVNAHGDVLGFAIMEDFTTAPFLYANGVMTNLGGSIQGWAADFNDAGTIVGNTVDGGYLYRNGTLTDLDTLIDPASGWTVRNAYAINNRDEIAVQVCGSAGCDLAMLTPVPEPATYGMLLAGLGLLGYLSRRAAASAARSTPMSPI